MIREKSFPLVIGIFKPAVLLLVLGLAFCLMASGNSYGQTQTAAEQAAEALLVEMKAEELLADSIDQMLALQVQMDPALAGSTDTMREILTDYLNFEAVKPFYIDVYVETFTAEELLELAAFYRTPVGQKSIVEMPALFAKSAQFGMQIMQNNAAEITRRMLEAQQEQAAPPEA